MKIVVFKLNIWILAFLLLLPSFLNAGDASKQLGATIDGFIPIISKTPRAELQVNGLPESARKLIVARFDFSDMTQPSLGPALGIAQRAGPEAICRRLYTVAVGFFWGNRALLPRG